MNNLEIAQHIANVLNEALALDPDGLSKLILRKEPINEAIALHPTIQVGIIPDQAYGLSPLGSMGFWVDTLVSLPMSKKKLIRLKNL
jgi:hypothetical protein